MNNESNENITKLYQNLEKKQPSAILDARIKKQAQLQLKRSKSSMTLRWLSAAALIVLSVGVVLRVIQETPHEGVLSEQDFFQISEEQVRQDADQEQPDLIVKEKQPIREKLQVESQPVPATIKPKLEAPALSQPRYLEAETFSDSVSGMTAKKQTRSPVTADQAISQRSSLPENWCGQMDLKNQKDKQVWLNRIEMLRQENDMLAVDCLQALFIQQFPEN